ncbi:hypothetical protein APT65_00032 [Trabzonvirus APT65]|uniref:Uncharacterized protein n=1 Tax=Aeromonas phage APT65 TaxID=2982914 RepID=A0A9E8JZN3_9CAUD|nr:hypothetical protein APT65_00032 [Aeromonas phage APT65]
MRKPRKKKIPEIKKIWDLPLEEIERIIASIEDRFPTSNQLESYRKEIKRREEGEDVKEVQD